MGRRFPDDDRQAGNLVRRLRDESTFVLSSNHVAVPVLVPGDDGAIRPPTAAVPTDWNESAAALRDDKGD